MSLKMFLLVFGVVIVSLSLAQGQEQLNQLSINGLDRKNLSLEMRILVSSKSLDSVQILRISNMKSIDLDEAIMSQFPNLKNLFIDRTNIGKLQPGTFHYNKHLQVLALDRVNIMNSSNLTEVLEQEPLASTLTHLSLRANGLFKVPVLPPMSALEGIDMALNKITLLDGNDFTNLPALRMINMEANMIRTIVPFSFGSFNDSKRPLNIMLDNNLLTSLQDVQDGLQDAQIFYLSLSNNQIESLPRLSSRFKVHSLILGFNKIVSLKVDNGTLFGENNYVRELDLEKNSMATLDPLAFADMQAPIKLSLVGNAFTSVRSFQGLENTMISELDLSLNMIPWLDRFPAMNNLKRLHLSSCQVRGLASNFTDNLISLEEISLDHNEILRVQPGTFESSKRKEKLRVDLSSNMIRRIEDLGLVGDSIQVLDLSRNRIFNLTELPFMPSLRNLSLSENNISRIDIDLFKNIPNIAFLDLSLNQITSLSEVFLKSIRNLRGFNLEDNKLEQIPSLMYISGSKLRNVNVAFQRVPVKITEKAFQRVPDDRNTNWLAPMSVDLIGTNISEISPKAFCSDYTDGIFISKLSLDVNAFQALNKCILRQLRMPITADIEFEQGVAIELGVDRLNYSNNYSQLCGCSGIRMFANKYNMMLTGICDKYPLVKCTPDYDILIDDCDQKPEFSCAKDGGGLTSTTSPSTSEPSSAGLSSTVVAVIAVGSILFLIGALSLVFAFKRFN